MPHSLMDFGFQQLQRLEYNITPVRIRRAPGKFHMAWKFLMGEGFYIRFFYPLVACIGMICQAFRGVQYNLAVFQVFCDLSQWSPVSLEKAK